MQYFDRMVESSIERIRKNRKYERSKKPKKNLYDLQELMTLTKRHWDRINKNDFDTIITTGQLFGEGTDLQSIESLFLVYPFSYEGKLIYRQGHAR